MDIFKQTLTTGTYLSRFHNRNKIYYKTYRIFTSTTPENIQL